jgi:deazaflavin-dependent oxidoreductase (nitroreductase family)
MIAALRRGVPVLALAAAVAVVVRAVRPTRTAEASPDRGVRLRRFVTHRFNPLMTRLGLVGGRRSPWGYIEHVGRKSGRVYRTPVLPMIVGGFAYIPLPYGPNVDWARNVRAAGRCRLQLHDTIYELDEPADITAAEHPRVPEALRPRLVRRGRRYLRLHALSVVPGRFGEQAEPEPVAAEPVAVEPVAAPPPVDEPAGPANLVPVRARSRAAALATPAPAPAPLTPRTSG